MKKALPFLLVSFLFSSIVFGQDQQYKDLFILNVDSLVKKQLTYQKQYKNTETLVFLKDSTINYYGGDVIEPCENQPTKTYYTYNINGLATLIQTEDTPEEGCNQTKREDIITYDEDNVITHITRIFNVTTNQWENSNKNIYQYDTNDNETEIVTLKWDTTLENWYNYRKQTKAYNAVNLITQNIVEDWDTSSNNWYFNNKSNYSYDNSNNILEYTYKKWNEDINDWETLRKNTYTYDTDSNLIEYVSYIKYTNEEIYEWSTIYKSLYSYDTNNYLIEKLYYSGWNNEFNDWGNLFKYNYINNSIGDPLETHITQWDNILEDWFNKILISTTYNENNLKTEELKQQWNITNTEWENNSLRTITYNDFLKKINEKLDYWYNDNWYNDEENTFEYDEHQNLIHINGYAFFEWWNIYHYYTEYDIVLNTEMNNKTNVYFYPNPSTDMLYLKGNKTHVNIVIYDSTGKKIMFKNVLNKIDISTLEKGVYFVTIQNNKIHTTSKLIKN